MFKPGEAERLRAERERRGTRRGHVEAEPRDERVDGDLAEHEAPPLEAYREDLQYEPPAEPLPFVDPITLDKKLVPEREWAVPGLVPLRHTTLFMGDGGVGKSTLLQQLGTAAAIGGAFLGRPAARMKAFYFSCEDDDDELHRRQAAINERLGIGFGDLENLLWTGRAGLDSVLMTFPDGAKGVRTEEFRRLLSTVKQTGTRLLLVDALHDVFGGDEVKRIQARGFIGALTQIAREIDGAVVAAGHPSVAGMASGAGTGGSTAWNNACRSRLYLTQPDEESDLRTLALKKANYGKRGDKIALRWKAGVFDLVEGGTTLERIELETRLIAFLDSAVKGGAKVAADPMAPTSLASRARKTDDFKNVTHADATAAQERLVAAGRLVLAEIGPPSRRYAYLRTPDTRYAGEAA